MDNGITNILTGNKDIIITDSIKYCLNYFKSIGEKKIKSDINKRIKYEKLENCIKEYLDKMILECGYIAPLALKRKGGKKLEDLYEPLTLVPTTDIDFEEKTITSFDFSIFFKRNRVLIEDNAGMGKSTLIKFLISSYIKKNELENFNRIPILLELRNLKENNSILDLIKEKVLNKSDDNELLKLLFKENLIIFFDGFDEISEKNKSKIGIEIKELSHSYSDNFYILTSRSENILSIFASYLKYKIRPLTILEAESLLRKYMQNDMKMYENLVLEIRKNYDLLKEFLQTPLLVSLLYETYSFKRNIPETKLEYYNQIFEALYQAHDSNSKDGFERKLELGNLEFRKVLEEFSVLDLNNVKLQFNFNEMIERLEKVKKNLNKEFDTIKFIENLEKQVPIFKKIGNDYIWCHKSMQEFFIAQKIYKSENKRGNIIKKMITDNDNSQYILILEFLYDLDSLTFQKILFEEIIKDIDELFSNNIDLNRDEQELLFEYPDVVLSTGKIENINERILGINKRLKNLESPVLFSRREKDLKFLESKNLQFLNHSYKSTKDKYSFNLMFSRNKYFPILKILYDRHVDIFELTDYNFDFLDYFDLIDCLDLNDYYYYSKNKIKDFNFLKNILHKKIFSVDYTLDIPKLRKKHEIFKLQSQKNIFDF